MEIGHRPWGYYEVIKDAENFKSKRITVMPNKKLSLQSHNFRSEHWICLSGIGQAQVNDQFITLKPNVHVFIDVKDKHRLINNGDQQLVIIEIQTGTYFGEDDIIRYEDDFGRV
jgi:mannose-1-phosphate guanylyltransferase/mannose-1-phosphate guanylyltransferase/mannose-6-phosphate isomerase